METGGVGARAEMQMEKRAPTEWAKQERLETASSDVVGWGCVLASVQAGCRDHIMPSVSVCVNLKRRGARV